MTIFDGLIVDSAQVVSSQPALQENDTAAVRKGNTHRAQLMMSLLTCSCAAAVSILRRACSVDDEDVDTDVLCLSHRTSSHIQDSYREETHLS